MKRIHNIPGFTLLELLIVLIIFVILIAVFFPVVCSDREKPYYPSCQSNEKQIGLALTQYVQDFDERYPTTHVDSVNPMQRMGIELIHTPVKDLLDPYIKSGDVWRCPADNTPRTITIGSVNEPVHVSYAINGSFEYGELLAAVQASASKITFLERAPEGDDDFHWWQLGRPDVKAPIPPWNDALRDAIKRHIALDRHQGHSNVLYADGHVKAQRFERLWGETRPANALWP